MSEQPDGIDRVLLHLRHVLHRETEWTAEERHRLREWAEASYIEIRDSKRRNRDRERKRRERKAS